LADETGTDGGLDAHMDGAEMTFEHLVREHARVVLAVCLARTRSLHDAEDAMQQVYLKALTRLDRLREKRRARAWLVRIARRTCADQHRKRRPKAALPQDYAASTASDEANVERLRAAIERLPEGYRQTITLYYLDGHSCAGVAESLGISEAAVRQRLVRARLMLHDFLTEEE